MGVGWQASWLRINLRLLGDIFCLDSDLGVYRDSTCIVCYLVEELYLLCAQ